jgi:hypothetical protein
MDDSRNVLVVAWVVRKGVSWIGMLAILFDSPLKLSMESIVEGRQMAAE